MVILWASNIVMRIPNMMINVITTKQSLKLPQNRGLLFFFLLVSHVGRIAKMSNEQVDKSNWQILFEMFVDMWVQYSLVHPNKPQSFSIASKFLIKMMNLMFKMKYRPPSIHCKCIEQKYKIENLLNIRIMRVWLDIVLWAISQLSRLMPCNVLLFLSLIPIKMYSTQINVIGTTKKQNVEI